MEGTKAFVFSTPSSVIGIPVRRNKIWLSSDDETLTFADHGITIGGIIIFLSVLGHDTNRLIASALDYKEINENRSIDIFEIFRLISRQTTNSKKIQSPPTIQINESDQQPHNLCQDSYLSNRKEWRDE